LYAAVGPRDLDERQQHQRAGGGLVEAEGRERVFERSTFHDAS
jgi:hypothetical protein